MMNPSQKRQQTLDRMRKKMIANKGEPKICLIVLIKDDYKNIINLLKSVKSMIDMIAIFYHKNDDNLSKIISEWVENNDITTKFNIDLFKNHGYNQTNSVKISKRLFPEADYFFISCVNYKWEFDINFKFNKQDLIEKRYDAISNINGDYSQKTILLSAKFNWICNLKTYEYWVDDDDKYNHNPKYIKSDLLTGLKFNYNQENSELYEDIILASDDLQNPLISKDDKLRIKFHLGITYQKLEDFEKSNHFLNERIEGGGWDEEIYCSIYYIGINYEMWGWKCKECVKYLNDDNYKNFIEKWNPESFNDEELLKKSVNLFTHSINLYKKSYEFRPTRSESLYNLTKLCRMLNTEEMKKLGLQIANIGSKIKLPNDILFVNIDCYDHLFKDDIYYFRK